MGLNSYFMLSAHLIRLKLSYCLGLVYIALTCTLSTRVQTDEIRPEHLEFFENRIRPLLVGECYECHNSHGKARGGLILDTRQGIMKGGDSGPVLDLSNPEASLLIKAVQHSLPDLEMPKSRPQLNPNQIGALVEWIQMGAPDPRLEPPTPSETTQNGDWDRILESRKSWWSFQPIQSHPIPLPEVSTHPIDGFIHYKLREKGLSPSPPADAEILARRLYINLIGLPPTKNQLDRFVEQHRLDAESATERLIDQLLASPQFGEQWAVHWMDWIRYAESHGSEGDPAIVNAYQYRNYLIRALNDDIPYDQLIREHIAGDLLDNPRINPTLGINESVIGTAHWRMVFHGFAPTDALEEKVRFTDDQINVFSKAFLGLTVSCARCHHHKFDPISQDDYYALFGILSSTRPGRTAIETPEKLHKNRNQLLDLKKEIRTNLTQNWLAQLESEKSFSIDQSIKDLKEKAPPLFGFMTALETETESLNDFQAAWRNQSEIWKSEIEQWESHKWESHKKNGYVRHWDFGDQKDVNEWYAYGSGLTDFTPDSAAFTIAQSGESLISGLYPSSVFTHSQSSKHGARFTSPDIQLDDEYELWLRVAGQGQAMVRYAVRNYPRDGTVYPVKQLNGNPSIDWHWVRFDLAYWKGDSIHIELATAMDAPLLVKNQPRSWFAIQEALISKKGNPPPPDPGYWVMKPFLRFAERAVPETMADVMQLIRQTLRQAVENWAKDELQDGEAEWIKAGLQHGWLPNSIQENPATQESILAYRALEEDIPIATRIPSLDEWKGSNQALFDRGNHKAPLHEVPRRFLTAIDPVPYEPLGSGRIELTQSLLKSDNPFTARVMVNRVWHHLFGRGLVATTDNFGRLGEPPSHPELLDFLALHFREMEGWSIKRLIRFIVTSKTWQQSSLIDADMRAADPDNKWLARHSVRRMQAETIRDTLLSVGNQLDLTLFGSSDSENSTRRSVYLEVIRNRPHAFLSIFDKPVPFSTNGRRTITTVPAQSLALMNGKLIDQISEGLSNSGSLTSPELNNEDRIKELWEKTLGRTPTAIEIADSLELVSDLKTQYTRIQSERKRITEEIHKIDSKSNALLQSVRPPASAQKKVTEWNEKLNPVAVWDFSQGPADLVGDFDLQLHGNSTITNESLVLDGQSWASTPPLSHRFNAKSLEVVFQLNDLSQQGGGIITLQSLDGNIFDSLVYGEQSAGHWLAGSNFFARTRPLGGAKETEADERFVHMILVYSENGTVTLFRNGQVYGSPYKTDLQAFDPNENQLLFGLRHGVKATDGRMFKGSIRFARLFDRALNKEDIQIATWSAPLSLPDLVLADRLTDEKRDTYFELTKRKKELEFEFNTLGLSDPSSRPWKDLALSLLNLKELIYVQ